MLAVATLSFLFGNMSVHTVDVEEAADKVELMVNNISKATYRQFSDSTSIGQMSAMYNYRRTVARSMLEWQVNNVCGRDYHDDYENVTKRMWEAFEKCGCKT